MAGGGVAAEGVAAIATRGVGHELGTARGAAALCHLSARGRGCLPRRPRPAGRQRRGGRAAEVRGGLALVFRLWTRRRGARVDLLPEPAVDLDAAMWPGRVDRVLCEL